MVDEYHHSPLPKITIEISPTTHLDSEHTVTHVQKMNNVLEKSLEVNNR
jgi:hypothetical protein